MKLLATFALLLSLAACKKDAPAPVTPPDNSGGDPVVDPYACSADDDCVAVERGCCDECNGGEAVGAHEDHVDEAMADGPQGRGECAALTACTRMGCAPWVATCQAGRCEIARGSFE